MDDETRCKRERRGKLSLLLAGWLSLILVLLPNAVQAWGGQGHQVACHFAEVVQVAAPTINR